MRLNDLFPSEEDKKIVIQSGVIAFVITVLFAIFVFVYTGLNP